MKKPKRKLWGYYCHPFKDLRNQKHKWRYGHETDKRRYVCSNCGLQRNSLKGLSSK